MSFDGQKIFELLPALYRLRDARIAESQGLAQGPLEALLRLVAEQLAAVEEDLDQLYDDQFIETCAPWVIPYIGDLIGYQAVKGIADAVANPRAEVAHTISFRRRKGTILVLEQLARDVTGWGAHAVEFFQVLADTQYLNHVRRHHPYAPDLRRGEVRDRLDTAFDRTSHTVDVRRVAVERGRYNIQNIGIFLWSLQAYRLTNSPAASSPGNPQCFRCSPLGADLPLFNYPVTQGARITTPATPDNVPDRLRRRDLCQDLTSGADTAYYGVGRSLVVSINGTVLNPSQIQVCNLGGDDGSWTNLPVAGSPYAAAIDPELGRLALPPSVGESPPQVRISFCYGFNADLGGGEYPRADSFLASTELPLVRIPADFGSVQAALDSLSGDGVVEITDSAVYAEPAGLNVAVKAGGEIELRAADGCRPTLVLGAAMTVTGDADGAFDLNGLLVTYAAAGAGLPAALINVPAGDGNKLTRLGLTHCTLVPGWALTPDGRPRWGDEPALLVELDGLRVVARKAILGGLRVAAGVTVAMEDSIVDATAPAGIAYAAADGLAAGGALTLTGCTIVGKVHASLLTLVSNSILWAELAPVDAWAAPLLAVRKQEGCVRFSYLPPGAVVPRRFECVERGPGAPQPLFTSLRYGDPGYAKLFAATPDAVRRGADDGGEMGGFHFVLAPLRESDLRTRLQEYTPVGLECGIFYET